MEFLVAHHLTMSHIAQRRDIDDPKTIADFAITVGDAQRLRMLYLLTYADMRAVGPGVLTGWQAAILHELYRRTLARLTSGREDKPNRTQLVERLREVVADDVPLQAVKAHVAMVPERYLTNTSVQRMAEHLRLIAPARRRAGGHRAVPPSRPRHLRLRRRHPRRARGCSP